MDIERVLVSPYLRAEQTLDIVGECMNLPKHVDVMPELTPCGDVGMVSAYLQALANEGVATALVVSTCRWWGIWSQSCVRETPPMFTTSAIACVTLDADGKVSSSGKKAPATSRWPTPSDGPRPAVTAAPAVAPPRPQSISAVRRHRRTLLVHGETP
ncbi:phosphohistidine phosphatase SixA [Klebsiella pneumoniae]|uniref:Phosphohistidine phosphatase SixA n=1 Tax=Klebsiella pneumoniae TaxID=573 RepID=A0A939NN38_KLEPN|nr:phosphohistidine phosphatase SixA [Klebsiella pneumoniae]